MKTKIYLFAGIFLTVFLFYYGIQTGSSDISLPEIISSFTQYNSSDPHHYIIVNLRLPRLFLAFLVGAGLSLSGYLMQAMVNNPLADPYILGTASGASLGASLIYLIIPASLISILIPSVAAFAGAIAITLGAVLIAYNKGELEPSRLLLAGVALSSLTVALISFMIFLSSNESKLKTIIFWSMGSFEGARWSYLPLLGTILLCSVILFIFLNKNIQLLLVGESRSFNLGLDLKKLRWVILLTSSLLTALAVATSGPIGFVGLMIPHFTRGLLGITFKYNVFYCSLFGGVYLLACDILSRKLYPPAGMPIGIITSFLGIPFFVYLLSRKNYRFG